MDKNLDGDTELSRCWRSDGASKENYILIV